MLQAENLFGKKHFVQFSTMEITSFFFHLYLNIKHYNQLSHCLLQYLQDCFQDVAKETKSFIILLRKELLHEKLI